MKRSLAVFALAVSLSTSASAFAADDAEIGKLITSLSGDDAAARKDAAKSIEALNADSVPAIAKELASLRKTSAAGPAVKIANKESGDLGDALVATKGNPTS